MHGYDWEVPGGHISSTIPISVRFFVCIGITADCGRGNKVLEDGFHERKVYENVMRIPWRLDTFIIVSLKKCQVLVCHTLVIGNTQTVTSTQARASPVEHFE